MSIFQTIFPLLLLQLVSGKMICPSQEHITPCKCSTSEWDPSMIDINCFGVAVSDVVVILKQFEGKTLDLVNLGQMRGGMLPSDMFSKVGGVREIRIEDVEGLADDAESLAFLGLENSLQRLKIINSFGDKKLARLNLGHLKRLTHLELVNNNIPDIRNDWFENGPFSLEELTIEHCGVRSLGDRAFRELSNLEELNIYANPIRVFTRTMFPAQGIRNGLVLWNISLTNPPKDLFSEMPDLKGLNLRDNQITHLSSDLFSSIWEQLSVLNLRDNPIVCDDHMDWMLKLRRPDFIAGYCESPSDQKGRKIESFIDGKKKEMEDKARDL